ncbi:MAG: protease modulator HflC [Enterobacterales bacterium]
MRNFIIILITLILIPICYSSLFIVHEGEKGIILRFGKLLRNDNMHPLIYSSGIHVKIPIIDNVKILDVKIQTMENKSNRFVTMEKKDVIIDSYVKWKIRDVGAYFLSTGRGNIAIARNLIKRKLFDRLRSELGKLSVKSIITDYRNRVMDNVRKSLNINDIKDFTSTQIISDDKNILDSIQNSIISFGIEIIDIRIKKINLPKEISDSIYKRMRLERESVARYHISKGKEESEKLRAKADYEVEKILALAKKQSDIFKGEADAETFKLYADAFNKSPEFYSFIRSLEAYEKIFNYNDTVILNSKSEFFKFMQLNNAFNQSNK